MPKRPKQISFQPNPICSTCKNSYWGAVKIVYLWSLEIDCCLLFKVTQTNHE